MGLLVQPGMALPLRGLAILCLLGLGGGIRLHCPLGPNVKVLAPGANHVAAAVHIRAARLVESTSDNASHAMGPVLDDGVIEWQFV